MKKILSVIMLGSVLLITGCGTTEKIVSEKPMLTEIIKKYNNIDKIISDKNKAIDSLSIIDAINIALKNNPELKSLKLEISALEYVAFQKGLMPNPELGIDAENIFGTNGFSNFRQSETTVSLSQNILLAGKLSKNKRASLLDADLAAWDYEAKRLEILTEVRKVFTGAIIIQNEITQNNELLKISREFVNNLKRRVQAGKISPAEVSRADIIVNLIEIDLENSEQNFTSALNKLKSLLGESSLTINNLKGDLSNISKLPNYNRLLNLVKQNPSLKRYEKEFEKQKAVIELEEANAIPDLTLTVGIRRLNETKDNTFVFGASIPLPFFNRNQGTIEEAKVRYNKKESEYLSVSNELYSKFNIQFNQLKSSLAVVKKLKNESIPIAKKAFKIIKEGNSVGKFTILDVLDIERTLFELQNQYLKRLGELNIILIKLEGLTGSEIKKEGLK